MSSSLQEPGAKKDTHLDGILNFLEFRSTRTQCVPQTKSFNLSFVRVAQVSQFPVYPVKTRQRPSTDFWPFFSLDLQILLLSTFALNVPLSNFLTCPHFFFFPSATHLIWILVYTIWIVLIASKMTSVSPGSLHLHHTPTFETFVVINHQSLHNVNLTVLRTCLKNPSMTFH